MNIVILLFDQRIGRIVFLFVVLYSLLALTAYFIAKPKLLGALVTYASNYGQVQRRLMKEMAVPYSVIDSEGHLLWMNDEFAEIAGFAKASRQSIFHIFESIKEDMLPKSEQDNTLHIRHNEKHYLVLFRYIFAADLDADTYWSYEDTDSDQKHRNSLLTMYLYDETEIVTLKKDLSDQKLIIGLLYIDNYEEALESIDEVRRSLLSALVERKINKNMQSIDAIIKKLEKDKYICIFQNRYLPQLCETRFPILDEVRGVNIGNELRNNFV